MKIAIQGHPTRGKEVIQILESLGGIDIGGLTGTCKTFYYINHRNNISDTLKSCLPPTYKYYTLEGFEKEFPFKIGDKVITTDGTIGVVNKLDPEDDHPYCIKADVGGFYWCVTSILNPYKEMQERNITLTLDKAKEWYKKGGELREIALQAFTEMELNSLPRSWKDYCKNYPIKPEEIFIDGYSKFIVNNVGDRNPVHDKNICPSRKSAEAHLAMIQLEQLRNCWWNGWEPEWNNCEKHVVKWEGDDLIVFTARRVHAFLVFPTREMAEEFLECFRDLIEIAKDLI